MGNSSSNKKQNIQKYDIHRGVIYNPKLLPNKLSNTPNTNNPIRVQAEIHKNAVTVSDLLKHNHESDKPAANTSYTSNINHNVQHFNNVLSKTSENHKSYTQPKNTEDMFDEIKYLKKRCDNLSFNDQIDIPDLSTKACFNTYVQHVQHVNNVPSKTSENHKSYTQFKNTEDMFDEIKYLKKRCDNLSSNDHPIHIPDLSTKSCFNKEKHGDENETKSTYVEDNKSANINAVPPSIISTKTDFMINWFSWKNEFLTYMKSSFPKESNKQIWNLRLLNYMGPVGQKICRSFTFNEDCEKEDVNILLEKFDLYCLFGGRKKGDDEEIDKYVHQLTAMALRHLADTDKIVKQKILMEIDKEKFTRKAESLIPGFSFASSIQLLTLKEITFIWVLSENGNFKKSEEINNCVVKNCNNCGKTHKINKCSAYGKECNKCSKKDHHWIRCPSQFIVNCLFCGEHHFKLECPAFANKCNKCQELNHFSWKCLIECNFCGLSHKASRSVCSAQNKICGYCWTKGHVMQKCKKKKPYCNIVHKHHANGLHFKRVLYI